MNILQNFWSWMCGFRVSNRLPKPRRSVSLGIEPLGERIVPAGNVIGVVSKGNLILTGDGEDNSIEIRNGIGGIRILGVAGTTINGAAGFDDFAGVYKDVIINLKSGEDHVNLEGGGGGTAAVIPRNLIFYGGHGDDTLTSESGAVIGRDLAFIDGTGVSNTTLDDLIVGRHAVFTGKGDVSVQSMNGTTINGLLRVKSLALAEVVIDQATLGHLQVIARQEVDVDLSNVFVGGNASILGGVGDDQIEMDLGTEILGSLAIRTRTGNDSVDPNVDIGGNAYIHLGYGANEDLDMSNMTVYGNLTVLSKGNGIDTWELDGVEVLGRTVLNTDGGNDSVVLNDSEFYGQFIFQGGAGADQVQISDGSHVTFNGVTVFHMGNGADTLQLGAGIGDANFQYLVTLHGGKGTDTLNDVNGDFALPPTILSF